jgi:hypothetical protein
MLTLVIAKIKLEAAFWSAAGAKHLDSVMSRESRVRIAMDWVWIDILKSDPYPYPYPSALLCHAHRDIYGHGCRPKSKPVRYPSIHGYQ